MDFDIYFSAFIHFSHLTIKLKNDKFKKEFSLPFKHFYCYFATVQFCWSNFRSLQNIVIGSL